MKPKVFIARPIPEEAVEVLKPFCDVRRWESDLPIPRERLLKEVEDAEGLITYGGKINAEFLQQAPKLKIVSNVSVGYNNFVIDDMRNRGVLGTHTPNVLDDSVADLTLGLMLAAARRIPEMDRLVKDGNWKSGGDEPYFGVDVHHASLGIIGMGRIGEAVARRAKFGFAMDVMYHNRRRKPEAEKELGVRYVEKDELLASADFIVLLTPLTAETEKLIGEREFAFMKRSAIFINVSRGKNVDEAALIRALETGKLAAAGLDVFELEPTNPDNPLLHMPQVITLPHIGSATYKTRMDMALMAVNNLLDGLQGKRPPQLVPELADMLPF